ncbi:MAG: hypothetical protein ACFHWX_21380 [Bacteroidota bacterium]
MKKYLLSGFLCLMMALACPAQKYSQSAGLRMGKTAGLTYKKFLAEEKSVELMMSGRNEGFQVITMFVNHLPMEVAFSEFFYGYYGLGGHVGFERFKDLRKVLTSIDPPNFEYEDQTYFIMGVDAVIGIEYRWLSIPMTVGFDLKPYFNYIGMRYTDAHFWDAAITLKYVF